MAELSVPNTDPGAVGCSMLFNVQSWKTSVGGLPKALRNNLTFMLLFKTTSAKELAEIAESVDGEIDTQTFLKLCHAAWPLLSQTAAESATLAPSMRVHSREGVTRCQATTRSEILPLQM